MVDQWGNANDVGRYEDDHQDHKPNEDAAADATDINRSRHDCLERIFDHLDVEDSLNVAHTCKHLENAATHWLILNIVINGADFRGFVMIFSN